MKPACGGMPRLAPLEHAVPKPTQVTNRPLEAMRFGTHWREEARSDGLGSLVQVGKAPVDLPLATPIPTMDELHWKICQTVMAQRATPDLTKYRWTQAEPETKHIILPGDQGMVVLDQSMIWEGRRVRFGWNEMLGLAAFSFPDGERQP
jgi:hypothetical protein